MVLFPSFNPTTFHFCFYFYIVFTLLLSLAFDEATRTSSPTTPTDALNAKKDTWIKRKELNSIPCTEGEKESNNTLSLVQKETRKVNVPLPHYQPYYDFVIAAYWPLWQTTTCPRTIGVCDTTKWRSDGCSHMDVEYVNFTVLSKRVALFLPSAETPTYRFPIEKSKKSSLTSQNIQKTKKRKPREAMLRCWKSSSFGC